MKTANTGSARPSYAKTRARGVTARPAKQYSSSLAENYISPGKQPFADTFAPDSSDEADDPFSGTTADEGATEPDVIDVPPESVEPFPDSPMPEDEDGDSADGSADDGSGGEGETEGSDSFEEMLPYASVRGTEPRDSRLGTGIRSLYDAVRRLFSSTVVKPMSPRLAKQGIVFAVLIDLHGTARIFKKGQ